MKPIKFNINSHISMTLTEHGEKILMDSRWWETSKRSYDPETRRFREQMWVWMNIFGEHIFNGAPCSIEGNIVEIEDYA